MGRLLRRLPFQLATFLGSALLFFVQPLLAKQILPWFGGGSAVWSAALLFFQLGLVAGYAYAHLTRRLGPSRQAILHLTLLAIAFVFLPVSPPQSRIFGRTGKCGDRNFSTSAVCVAPC